MVPKNNDGVREIKVQPKHQENPIIQAEKSLEKIQSPLPESGIEGSES